MNQSGVYAVERSYLSSAGIKKLASEAVEVFSKYGWNFDVRFDYTRDTVVFTASSESDKVYNEVSIQMLQAVKYETTIFKQCVENLIGSILKRNEDLLREELDILDSEGVMRIRHETMRAFNDGTPQPFENANLSPVNPDTVLPENEDDRAMLVAFREYYEGTDHDVLSKLASFMWSRLYGRIPVSVVCGTKKNIEAFLKTVENDYRAMEAIKKGWSEPDTLVGRPYVEEDRERGQKF